MKKKIIGICLFMMLITTVVLPVPGLEKTLKTQTMNKSNSETLGSLNGIRFYQMDYTLKNDSCEDSYIGAVVVDIELFTSQYDLTSGYLNIMTPLGWVVQNWYISSEEDNGAIPYAICKFNLREGPPCGIDVKGVEVYFEFSEEPKTTFYGDPPIIADTPGRGEDTYCVISPPPEIDGIEWDLDLETDHCRIQKKYLDNVQAAKNQCGPAAVANSLQYLENRFPGKINILHDNILGIGITSSGIADPDNSLVAQLDLNMSRKGIYNRVTGSGVSMKQFLEGKLRYLDSYHDDIWGQPIGVIHRCSEDLTHDVKIGNTISKYDGPVATDFIFDKICQGLDVEILINQGSCADGHVVQIIGAGTILGHPYIRHISDLYQTDIDPLDNLGNDTESWDILKDDGTGLVYVIGNYFFNGSYIDLIVAQFPNDPPWLDIFGPDIIKTDIENWWILEGYDYQEDGIYFYIDWGDGIHTNWIGSYSIGEEIEVPHTYKYKGTYIIRVKARDEYGAQSDWKTLEVVAPRSKQYHNTILNLFDNQYLYLFSLLQRLLKQFIFQ